MLRFDYFLMEKCHTWCLARASDFEKEFWCVPRDAYNDQKVWGKSLKSGNLREGSHCFQLVGDSECFVEVCMVFTISFSIINENTLLFFKNSTSTFQSVASTNIRSKIEYRVQKPFLWRIPKSSKVTTSRGNRSSPYLSMSINKNKSTNNNEIWELA